MIPHMTWESLRVSSLVSLLLLMMLEQLLIHLTGLLVTLLEEKEQELLEQ